jgi:hypothetical protein
MDSDGGNGTPQPPYGDPYSQPESPPPPPYSDPTASPPPPYSQPGSTPPPYSQPGSPAPPYSQPGSPPPYSQPGGNPPPYGQPSGGTPPPYAAPGADPSWSPGQPGQGFGAPAYPPDAGARAANNKKLAMIGAAVGVVVILVIVIVVVAGGGSGNSPTATVNGFIQAALANNGKAVCSYFPPADQAECNAGSSIFHNATGSAQVDSSVTQGTEALVSVTGRICAPFISGSSGGSDCASNSNASAGMPGNGVSFDQAFAASQNESNTTLSPVPVEELNGKWYLDSGG